MKAKLDRDRGLPRRYAAKLLFQTGQVPDRLKRRMCEERILVFEALTARAALTQGEAPRACSLSPQRFIGIMELLFLDPSYMEPEEVWLDFVFRVTPMKRRHKLIPPESELDAIRNRS